jgi:hypothetical protein
LFLYGRPPDKEGLIANYRKLEQGRLAKDRDLAREDAICLNYRHRVGEDSTHGAKSLASPVLLIASSGLSKP